MISGLASLGLGIVGAFLPLLPTVPLLLLAAFCFARSSDRLHDWLINHRQFGPYITNWRQRGAIGRRSKIVASLSMMLALALSWWMGFGGFVLGLQAIVLTLVAVFIWTRPSY